MKNINIGEYWHVQYGLQEKTNIIVRVVGLSENGKSYECEHKGESVIVDGICFVTRFDD